MAKPNVVIFGGFGTGKSSIVNLITGQNDAHVVHVADSATSCTFQYRKYETPNYNIVETVGLVERCRKFSDFSSEAMVAASKQLSELLKCLEDGVSLLVFVVQKGRIKNNTEKNYKLFADTLCMEQVPVMLVVTHCEFDNHPEEWWDEIKCHYDDKGMLFRDVVFGCAMVQESAPQVIQLVVETLNDTMASTLNEKIDQNMPAEKWIPEGGADNWHKSVSTDALKILGFDM